MTKRYRYGYCSVKTSVDSDLTDFITKTVNIHLNIIGEYVTKLCRSYMNELDLCNMNFIQGFNLCKASLVFISHVKD